MLGVKTGVNSATIDVSSIDTEQRRTAFAAGATLGVALHRAFVIQFEALYMQKGAKAGDEDETERLWVNYLELPLFARVRVPLGSSPVHPTFYVGPTFAFEVSCTLGLETGGQDFETPCGEPGPVSELDPIETVAVDFGVAFGGGLEIVLGRANLSIEGRYTNGFTNVIIDENTTTLKNRVVSVLVGLAVPLR